MKHHEIWLSDDRFSTPEYIEHLWSMTPEEFEDHITKLKAIEELDVVADRAGGYVLPPWDLEENPEGMRKFSAIRQYALENNKPISQFTEEDYRNIGVEPLR